MDRFRRQALVAAGAVVAIGVLGAASPGSLRAADPPWEPPACAPGAVAATGGTMAAGRVAAMAGAWFALDHEIDEGGALTGLDLRLGTIGDARGRRVALPPEAFATGPYGGAVLVGEDEGRVSRLRLVRPDLACAQDLGSSAAVIRTAVVDPRGAAVYEHRVDRDTRADLGIWRRPLDGGEPGQVLRGMPPSAAYGPTFVTELAWGPDGRLAVASCGERACRIRVLEPAAGAVREVGPTGPILGLTRDEVVAWEVCPGLPCAIQAVNPAGGARRTLVSEAGPAVLAGGGTLLVHEAPGGIVRSVRIGDGRVVAEAARPAGHTLVPATSAAGRGATAPPGWLVLAGDEADRPGDVAGLSAAGLEVRLLREVAP